LTVEISGLVGAAAGAPETFEWRADRPIALVVVRSGIDGDDVAFQVGPMSQGVGRGASVGDGSGIRYIAFCYDTEPDAVGAPRGDASPRPSILARLRPAASAS
jgi:hypothetical protein